MIRPVLRFSKIGLIAAGLFLCLAAAAFFWILHSAASNPADSGESGILLLPFAMPWVMILPQPWLGLTSGIGSIFFNALILYLIFGGLRFRRADPPGSRSCPHCGSDPVGKAIPAQSNFRPYNICRECGNKFTVDRKTVRRHLLALVLALAMLGATVMVMLEGSAWLGPAVAAHALFWLYLIHANNRVILVPYEVQGGEGNAGGTHSGRG